MKIGTTIGPNLGLVDEATGSFDFVEPALNADDCRVGGFDADRFREKLDAAGLDCTVHLPHFPHIATTIPEIDAALRQYHERALRKAAKLDADIGVIHAATKRHTPQYREAFVEQATWLAEACRDHGMTLAIENVGHVDTGFLLSEVAEIAHTARASVCFDVGHAYQEGGQRAIETFLCEHGECVSHLHVHDARERGDDHIPIGTGTIDFAPVMTWAAKRDVTAAVELLVDEYTFQRESVRRLRALTPD